MGIQRKPASAFSSILKGSSNNSFWRTNESFYFWLLSSLPENKYLLFAAQKQLLEPPLNLKFG
jgi:hypothetical protein